MNMQIFLNSLVVCLGLVYLLRGLACRFGLVDHPGGRKLHAHPTPTLGGVAMFLSVALTMYFEGYFFGNIKILIACSALLVVLGMMDDRFNLPVSLRLMAQVFFSLLVILGAGGMITHLGGIFGSGDIQLGLFAVPFSVIALVGGINAMNMIDGADGMAGKMALITTIGTGFIFYVSGEFDILPLTWAMIGALVGFLIFNSRIFVRRAWVFMGDAGSMWLGLVLGWFMVHVTVGKAGAEPAIVLWLFGIPLIDTLCVIIRRLKRRVSPFSPDRTHIHHVFEHSGLSVRTTVLLLTLIQTALVGIGVIFYLSQVPAALIFGSFVTLMLFYYYLIQRFHGTIPQPSDSSTMGIETQI